MSLTLSGWRTSAAILIVQNLPLQTYDASLLLADAYLATNGGWTPDSDTDSTGTGTPANGASVATAVATIVETQSSRVYHLQGSMSIDIDLNFITNLAENLDDDAVIAQMKPLIEDFVQAQLANSPLAYSATGDVTGTVVNGGTQTTSQRQEVYSAIMNGQTLRDPRVVALMAAQKLYGLSDRWNVHTVYTEQNSDIVVIIREYEGVMVFDTLESDTDTQYVISINSSDYKVTGGVVSSVTT